eukprot:CAMPEP_0184486954 /NCGR_PEP_ID=MMETSP0113_2-20130426/8816_1 /TAXON_ID=91329 /ORGANISM="Norrisiella sphaerica, Strain BC52" /LENGTH=330 /DNA_ID=CAMNT_0026869045 /DNA_START=282 /DNA_END=1274 /DNA_ORIENTATION=+
MNRAAKESLTSGLRPRVTNAAPPAGLVCRVRSIAQQLRPRALIVASEKLASTMRGGREKTINRCTTVATAASVASSETVSKSNMYSYDHLFMKPPSGTDMKLSGTALILLNTPFDPNLVWLIRNLWGRVNVVVCADGAANRLYSLTESTQDDKYVPDYVCGDLDSTKPEVADYYRSKGVNILRIDDVVSNDLEKCLKIVKEKHGVDKAVLCGGLGGRFDHEMGNINALVKNMNEFEEVVLVGESSLVQVLRPGYHSFKIDKENLGPNCGIIPVNGKVSRIDTTGLKWNLEGQSLAFGSLVSTSNVLDSDHVTIRTSSPIVWTISIPPKSR